MVWRAGRLNRVIVVAITADHQAGILSAQTKRVVQRCADLNRTCSLGHIIQVAFRVRDFVVRGGMDDALMYGQNTHHPLDRPCPAHWVAEH